jgi:hypothetical protein
VHSFANWKPSVEELDQKGAMLELGLIESLGSDSPHQIFASASAGA